MAEKCVMGDHPATKKVIWADGRAYQPSCDEHVKDVQRMLTKKNGKMTELAGVQDLSDPTPRIPTDFHLIDLVSSRAYPGLERKPGGPDNWVEAAKGLPSYIERIAKHLHYERGFSISHAIASAVNTVKRWARMGKVAKYGDPNNKRVSAATAAKAAAAVASWEAKKRAGALALTEAEFAVIDLASVSEEFALELLPYGERVAMGLADPGASLRRGGHAILSAGDIDLSEGDMDIQALADRANQIEDPVGRARARQAILDLAVPSSELTADKRRQRAKSGQAMKDGSFPIFDRTSLKSAIRLARTPEQRAHAKRRAAALGLESMIPDQWDLAEDLLSAVIDLASTIPPRNARGRAKDGRKSFRGQGKWRHGFVPANKAAKEAKAKGSPIAMKRMNRLFGKDSAPDDAPKQTREVTKPRVQAAVGRAGSRSAGGRKTDPHEVKIDEKSRPGSERARDVGFIRHSSADAASNRPAKGEGATSQKEASKETRIPERARQNWDEIPETLKTVRGGKRYVVAEFGGKQYVTEWVGGVREQEAKNTNIVKSLTTADAMDMGTSELRRIATDPKVPAATRRVARQALRSPARKAKSSV